jgi:hypothetical protein
MIGIQPSPSRAARLTTASDEPPNQIGIGCTIHLILDWKGHWKMQSTVANH